MTNLSNEEMELLYRLEVKPELVVHFFNRVRGIKWLDELIARGYFDPRKMPNPIPDNEGYVSVPSWPAIQYLVTICEDLSGIENSKYADKVISLLRDITKYASSNQISNYRVWRQFAKVIRNIPFGKLKYEDLELVKYWLNDRYEKSLVFEELGEEWFPQLLGSEDSAAKQFALGLLNELFAIHFVENKYGSYQKHDALFLCDSWYVNKLIEAVAKLAGSKLGLKAVSIFESKLILVLETIDNDKWSYLWRPAIEEHSQNRSSDDVEETIIVALRDCFLAALESDFTKSREHLKGWLESDKETLKRLAIFVICQNYTMLSSLLSDVLSHSNFNTNMTHELWHLLEKRFDVFEIEDKATVLNIICLLEVKNEFNDIVADRTAYQKLVWLSAIKDKDQKALELYRENLIIAGSEPKHPDFPSYSSSGVIVHESPIEIEKLLSLNVEELIVTLSSYKETGRFGEPGLEGLAKTFRQLIKFKPLLILKEANRFAYLDLAYIYEVIEAYHDLWNEKVELDWAEILPLVFDFIDIVIEQDSFWSAESAFKRSSFVGNSRWIVVSIARLLEDGVKDDGYAFEVNLLSHVKNILLVMLDKQSGDDFSDVQDAVSWAINSPRGKCLEGLINLALRRCRLSDTEFEQHDSVWIEFEPIFTKELNYIADGNHEFGVLVTLYLPNFLYMSKSWVHSNLGKIFNQSNSTQWLFAIQGYAYVSNVYEEVYDYLKRKDDFIKVLDNNVLKDKVKEKVIQNVLVSYIHGNEDLGNNDDLISILVKRNNYTEIKHIIWFIWTLRKKEVTNILFKVNELWPLLLSNADKTTKEGKKILSSLCHWAAFVEEISEENLPWLLSCAPYANEDHNSHDLIRELARLSNSQPFEAQSVLIEILHTSHFYYPEDEVKKIMDNLILQGVDGLRKAKNIADAFLSQGVEDAYTWLNELKEKHKTPVLQK